MSVECVVAIYKTFEDATAGVKALDDAGFPHTQVSFVTHQVQDYLPKELITENPTTDPTAAATVGGLVGLLLGAPLVAIPGIGPLLLAGPVAVGVTGAVVGGFLGAMSGWGVQNDHIARYQQHVQDGHALIVAIGDSGEVSHAERTLSNTSTLEISRHATNESNQNAI